jgi:hypothetical protein
VNITFCDRPLQVNDTWIAQALDEGLDLFPRGNHHGQLLPSFVYDALQCDGGSLLLRQLNGHIPRALTHALALQVCVQTPAAAASLLPPTLFQRFPSFFPWMTSCAAAAQ